MRSLDTCLYWSICREASGSLLLRDRLQLGCDIIQARYTCLNTVLQMVRSLSRSVGMSQLETSSLAWNIEAFL